MNNLTSGVRTVRVTCAVDGKPGRLTLNPSYTMDQNGYNGFSEFMEYKGQELALFFFPNGANVKKLCIPYGVEGDQFLLLVMINFAEEMEADGQDASQPYCVFVCKILEHFDLGNDNAIIRQRLEPIYNQTLHKLARNKIDGIEFDLEATQMEMAAGFEEFRENIRANANRLDHVEERLDGAEDQLDHLQEQVNDLRLRVQHLEVNDGSSLYDSLLKNPPHVKVPTELHRHWRAVRYYREMLPHSAESIKYYTTQDGYREINTALRSNNVSGEIQNRANSIVSGMSTIIPYIGRAYRGVDMPGQWVTNITEQISAPGTGRLRIAFSDAAFLSASTQITGAFKSKSCRFVIQSKTGKSIAPYSVHPAEHEVLFPPLTQFTIFDAAVFDNGNLFIRMREN